MDSASFRSDDDQRGSTDRPQDDDRWQSAMPQPHGSVSSGSDAFSDGSRADMDKRPVVSGTLYMDSYGFEFYKDSAEACRKWEEAFRPIQRQRQGEIDRILANSLPSLKIKAGFKKYQKLCRNGLFTTAENRGFLWAHALGATDCRNAKPNEYQERLNATLSDKVKSDIECDIGRSIVNHEKFRGRNSLKGNLRRVLRALADAFPEVGYVQGMNIVCGQLLVFMEEDLAYWCMVCIFKGTPHSRHPCDLGLMHYYTPSMELFFFDMKILDRLIRSRRKARATLEALERHDLTLDQFVVRWFLTFTSGALPSDTTLRIWDSFFVEGIKVILRVIVVLFERHKDEFVRAKDLEGVMSTWKRVTDNLFNHEELIVQSLKVTSSEFKRRKIHTPQRISLSSGKK